MKFKITIDLDKLSFQKSQGNESAQILRLISERIEDSKTLTIGKWGDFTDSGGKFCGKAWVSK